MNLRSLALVFAVRIYNVYSKVVDVSATYKQSINHRAPSYMYT